MTPHRWVLAFLVEVTPVEARRIGLAETDGKRAMAVAETAGPRMAKNDFRLTGPSCYHCEQDWTIAAAAQPCPGDPAMRRAD